MTYSILFVCLGNICRSPLAEAAFREEARRLKLDAITDSAGTGNWHVGSPPDPRAQAVALKNGVDISTLRGRQVKPADFRRFTHLVAMDHDNLANLRRLAPPDATAELSLLLDHVEGRAGQTVADPYFGEDDGFDVTWADVTTGARALAAKLQRHRG
ncbi:Low molecular weight protein tyrosine phosphatase [Brevundimonas diminuta 3F5N]|uniref:protein-tyrosine-phosphatase n=1 Tax=Brevundimonas diminuta 3F5N TaxID=1255603 RepID=A0A1R4GJ73_BREDI|nr:low molecular weight protein-tyrosine-phosphatase [Brevundimonas diminuta]SJM68256.1 Low molecular weight protein tyrosine phosphatase [Brevundimonas diminuta 3F5N]